MANVLICYGTTEGQTGKIAARMAEFAAEWGHAATVADAATSSARLPLGAFDAVVVAASVHRRRHQESVERFVRENLPALQRLPTAFFSVSLSAAGREPRQRDGARACADAFLQATGWRPGTVRLVAGALAYSRYGLLTRRLMQLIAWRESGDTDTSRDYEYTDWEKLRRDLEVFLAHAVPREADLRPIFAGEGV
ncbi:MAG TPA: flavodoxin domain-containing protein [Longimicrobiaceae bacterium]|nr:flavodoxin domain-containing protein [Longimicrobiaceae bacterium]